jgi:hypothetical protein
VSTHPAVELATVYEATSGQAPDPGFADRVRAILAANSNPNWVPEYLLEALKHAAPGEDYVGALDHLTRPAANVDVETRSLASRCAPLSRGIANACPFLPCGCRIRVLAPARRLLCEACAPISRER